MRETFVDVELLTGIVVAFLAAQVYEGQCLYVALCWGHAVKEKEEIS